MTIALTPPATIFAWTGTSFAGAPAALFALDAALADVLRTTRQPLVGQMRLTWWHEALSCLGERVPAQPVLAALARNALPRGVNIGDLTRMVEGWEALLEEPIDAAAVARHGARGEGLFAALAAAAASPAGPMVLAAGRGWALADLAAHLSDPGAAVLAEEAAAAAILEALAARWPRPRMLGAMAVAARMALAGQGGAGSPRRAARVLRFGWTGR